MLAARSTLEVDPAAQAGSQCAAVDEYCFGRSQEYSRPEGSGSQGELWGGTTAGEAQLTLIDLEHEELFNSDEIL